MARATYFCVDIECSGPVPGLYEMVSLGAVTVVPDGQGWRVTDDPFYVEIRPTGPRIDAGAMKVNGLDYEKLKREGTPLLDALASLTAFVRERTLPGTKPVFVGHNAPFDWSFVNHAYHAADLPNPFGYKALDTKAFASGVLKLHWFDADKERLAERLVLPPVEAGKVHRADYDAFYQAHILARLLEAAGITD
jgi:DNA polymerase III epsilon subunit-like protein